jgi:hypothetical protein
MATSDARPFHIKFPGSSATLYTGSTVYTFTTKSEAVFFSKFSRTRVENYTEMDFSYFPNTLFAILDIILA